MSSQIEKTPKNNKPLTRKQQAFVKHLIEHPKESATKAVQATYSDTTYRTARQIATENLAKPSIISELSKYNNLVENTLINTIDQWGDHDKPRQREIAQQAAMYVHDKIHGKAKQSVDVHSTSVTFNIDLTQAPEETS